MLRSETAESRWPGGDCTHHTVLADRATFQGQGGGCSPPEKQQQQQWGPSGPQPLPSGLGTVHHGQPWHPGSEARSGQLRHGLWYLHVSDPGALSSHFSNDAGARASEGSTQKKALWGWIVPLDASFRSFSCI